MIRIEAEDDTPELFAKLEKAISRFIRKGVTHIEGELKSSIAEPKSGRKYKRKGGKTHVASAPGESPASDSSDYINSIGPPIFETLEGKVGTPLEYPVYLEEGTSTIAERPLWAQTAHDVLPTLEALLASEIGTIR